MFDTDSFLYVAKKVGLSFEELSMMDIGQVMEFIVEYSNSEEKAQERKTPTKKANQADFDSF